MEVVEHIVHIVTNVGFHHVWPEVWGLTRSSRVWAAITEAQKSGAYDISGYKSDSWQTWMTDSEFVRIVIQEYAYWLITSHWGIQEPFGSKVENNKEWSANTEAKVKKLNPLGHALLVETVDKVMAAPSTATLDELNNFGRGHTPPSAASCGVVYNDKDYATRNQNWAVLQREKVKKRRAQDSLQVALLGLGGCAVLGVAVMLNLKAGQLKKKAAGSNNGRTPQSASANGIHGGAGEHQPLATEERQVLSYQQQRERDTGEDVLFLQEDSV
jgi:hypothetical protein